MNEKARREALKPDKERLEIFMNSISAIVQAPQLKLESDKAILIYDDTRDRIDDIIVSLKSDIENL